MTTRRNRDDFSPQVKDTVARRASFICSNPDCHALTLAPSTADVEKVLYLGVAAHLTAAAPGGARYDSTMLPEQRASIDNAIFLCVSCSSMVDKNLGVDFPLPTLSRWKADHEEWVRANLNRRVDASAVQAVSIGPNLIQSGSLIVSQHQLGGQVAHSITNVGPQPRKLSSEAVEALVAKLKMHPAEEIDLLVANDPESHSLKEVIKGALLSAGWSVTNDIINMAPTKTGIHIDILEVDKGKASLAILLTWMQQVGLVCKGTAYTGGVSRPHIYVGSNPF